MDHIKNAPTKNKKPQNNTKVVSGVFSPKNTKKTSNISNETQK
jgi:hypothetical protein